LYWQWWGSDNTGDDNIGDDSTSGS
jgi:hypothetical protein